MSQVAHADNSDCHAVMEATEAMRLLRLVGLSMETRGWGATGEVAGEDWLEEGAEDDLSTTGLGKGHPENEDELESVVEREPVNGVHSALENCQEGVDNPISQPLGIIARLRSEQSLEGVVGWDGEADGLDEEVGGDVEEDQEEVQGSEAEDDVDLWHIGLLFEVVEGRVFGELTVQLVDVVLRTILEGRHC